MKRDFSRLTKAVVREPSYLAVLVKLSTDKACGISMQLSFRMGFWEWDGLTMFIPSSLHLGSVMP